VTHWIRPRLQKEKLGGTPCRGRVGFPRRSRTNRSEEEVLSLMCPVHIQNLEVSLPHGSCAPEGDGALRRAGGAV
jgi:hypothetical protein